MCEIASVDATDFSWMLTEVREVCQTDAASGWALSSEVAPTAEHVDTASATVLSDLRDKERPNPKGRWDIGSLP